MGMKDLDRAGMRDLLFAHDASLMVTLGRTESVFSGASGVADFELQLLVSARIVPTSRSRPTATISTWPARRSLGKEKSPKALFAERADSVDPGGHPWLRRATPATLDRFDREAARRLYDKLFGNVADFVFFFAGGVLPRPPRRGPLSSRCHIGSLPAAPKRKFAETDFRIVPERRNTTRSSRAP